MLVRRPALRKNIEEDGGVEMKYIYWGLLWLPMFAIAWLFRLLAPVACLFVVTTPRTDIVKRFGKEIVTMQRDKLVWWLTWFDTHDNATDEYWYGVYPLSQYCTQEKYEDSKICRWFFRVCWLWRNSAYTFNRKFFGLAKDSPLAWQYKAKLPLLFGYYNDVNIGYKAHKGFDKLMFAGRILGIRKQNNG